MKELSLNILDITQNSIKAGAKNISIFLDEDTNYKLTLRIIDDGCGMTAEVVERVKNPFFTSRTTRKVGLGIPFLTLAAEQTGGGVSIESFSESEYPENHGTTITATFDLQHIDFTPLGDMVTTISLLIHGNPGLDFEFRHTKPSAVVELSTRQMLEVLGEIPLDSPEVIEWIRESLAEQYLTFYGD
ncbi:MAG: hypothetical protein A2Y17_08310 [Clostridiales bacterium GWF2_38_85]|nr:MAG: hypothetical protein A2Y17_08310 [Clostridiales bacterium GWF2_38_85]HBL83804.1 ATP-binding protein [Clostridiales bacterium]